MRTYGQSCPIARGAEIFAERWTPLIIRNVHMGCETFGEILDGAPGLSRTLLTQRLRQLERLGVVESAPKRSHQAQLPTRLSNQSPSLALTTAQGRGLPLPAHELGPRPV
jgi:DNA-binding HxlR family transcriptional regulator